MLIKAADRRSVRLPGAPRPMIGTTLSHFNITAKLGEGGMGEVYLAEDTLLGREVALKILPEAMAGDPERLERFEREAKAIAALNHPNIVTIHSVEEAAGVHLLTMELVEGKSLDQMLPKAGFGIERMLALGRQIADALAAAHDKGVVHRDLKPANVMVTGDGRVKVLDFGLAKLAESEADEAETELLTQAGMVLGTVPYMSPEQVQGQPVDHRSDIFSLGIMLYEMATGERPFRGENPASVISAVLKDQPPPVTQIKAELPNHLGRVVRRCLEKDPQRRFQTARDVRLELEGLESELQALPSSAGRPAAAGAEDPRAARTSRWLLWTVAAAGGAVVAALALFGAFHLRATPEQPVVVTNILPPPGTVFNTADGPPQLSPDGRRIAFLAGEPGEPSHLFVRSLEALEARRIEDTAGAVAPFWSPSGEHLGFFADGKLKRVGVEAGSPRPLADAPWPAGGSWTRSGKIIYVGHATSPPSMIDASGGEPAAVSAPYKSTVAWYEWPQILPDDRHYLLGMQDLSGNNSGILLASLDPDEGFRVLTRRVSNAAYVESGNLLLWEEGSLVARPFDMGTRELGEGLAKIADGVGWGQYLAYGRFTASQQGTLVYHPGAGAIGDTKLVRVDRDGRELSVVAPRGEYYFPRLSHDGKRLAVDSTDIQTTQGDVWIFEVERGTRTRLSAETRDESFPVWLPDDSEIIFLRAPELFRRDSAAAGDAVMLFEDGLSKQPQDISPDGEKLLYQRTGEDGNDGLWVLDLETKEARPFVDGPAKELAGRFSPDGNWVAYESDESGRREIYVRSFPDGKRRFVVSTNGGKRPVWRADGSELYYYAPETRELDAVAVRWLDATPLFGVPGALFETPVRDGFDVFPDGQSFLLNKIVTSAEDEPMVVVQNWQSLLP